MRIGIHLQAFRPGEIGGLEVYVRALVEKLPALDSKLELVLVGTTEGLSSLPDHPRIEKVELEHEEIAGLEARAIARWGLDLWFCPLLALQPEEPGLPTVVTIPDLQHEVYPEFFEPEILAWRHRLYPRTVERAERVLTHSEHARGQIIDRLGAEPSRVEAIPLDANPMLAPERAGDARYLERVRQRHGLPSRYFFYPGNLWPHKNHRTLLRALGRLRRDRPDVALVLTGARPDSKAPADWPALEEGVLYLGYVANEDLAGLYALSLGLVFASLYEGFGLPVVEAMRIGCPVACSDTTSLPEIGGEAALYFDPEDEAEIARRMRQLCDDGSLRDELVAAGRSRARRFSWRDTARATLEVFRTVAGGGRELQVEVRRLPSISVIVPSFQQAAFLPRTLDSILGQGVPDLQVIVVDGGSEDGSAQILTDYRARYPERLEFVSEPDRGQAHAVNKGLLRARGEIIGWLNSDDTYAPLALLEVARAMASRPACKVLYGRADYIDTDDAVLGPYPTREIFDWESLAHECFLCQPSVFWRRELVDEGFHLNEDLLSCMDYDLWIRLGKRHEFHFLDRVLAHSRIYPENKTLARRDEVFDEVFRVVSHHYGRIPFSWALGRAAYRLGQGPSDLAPDAGWRAHLRALATLIRRHGARPRTWPPLWREIRYALGSRHAVRRSGNRFRVPGGWGGLAVRARVGQPGLSPLLVRDEGSGRVLGLIVLENRRPSESIIGLPASGSSAFHRLVFEGDLRSVEDLEVGPYPLLPGEAGKASPERVVLPHSWKSAQISVALREPERGAWSLLFRHRGREIARWSFSCGGAFRRILEPPGGAKDLEVELLVAEDGGEPRAVPVPDALRSLEMQEGGS